MPNFSEAVKKRRYREITDIDNGAVPSAVLSNVTVEEQLLEVHKTVINLAALPVSLTDLHVGGGTKIFTFPEGRICVLGAHVKNLQVTTTSVLASTLNAGVNLSVGVGSVVTATQDSGTLATTQQDVVNQFTAVSSATINVAGAAVNGNGPSAPLSFDGTTTPQPLYLNIGVPTGTDIDGDATVTVDALVEVAWVLIGDH